MTLRALADGFFRRPLFRGLRGIKALALMRGVRGDLSGPHRKALVFTVLCWGICGAGQPVWQWCQQTAAQALLGLTEPCVVGHVGT